jgi:hypothetical protein
MHGVQRDALPRQRAGRVRYRLPGRPLQAGQYQRQPLHALQRVRLEHVQLHAVR